MLGGLTAAKKLPPPPDLSTRKQLSYFHDIVLLELSTAQIKKAKSFTLEVWSHAGTQIINQGSGRLASPLFCKVKSLILSMESGGFGEHTRLAKVHFVADPVYSSAVPLLVSASPNWRRADRLTRAPLTQSELCL